MSIPKSFVAATTISFTISDDNYNPANGFSLTFYLAGQSRKNKVATTENPTTFRLTLASSDTDVVPGIYWYQAKATKGDEAYVVTTGQIEILPDFSGSQDQYDGRSKYQKIVDAIDTAIARGELSYTIGNRQVTFKSNEELLKARTHYVQLIEQQKHRSHLTKGGSFFQNIKTKFTR